MMLKELMEENGMTMDNWQYNEHGKPFMQDGPFFSISHSKEGIAVVVDKQPIGIDIEAIRRVDEELVERTMNEAEQAYISASEDRDRAFTALWTKKEAIVKAQGVGIISFEQIQSICAHTEYHVDTVEKENYIYSIASK